MTRSVRNNGLVDKVVVDGTHTPIITKEEYRQVQDMLESKVGKQNAEKRRGVKRSKDFWCSKARCACGVALQKQKWHRMDDGQIQYAYRCYNQVSTGSIETRKRKGLSIDGICDTQITQKWKLDAMSYYLFEDFWKDKKEVLRIANELLQKHIDDTGQGDFGKEIKIIESGIEVYQEKLDNLVEMRIGGEISKEIFLQKKIPIEKKIEALRNELSQYIINDSDEETDYKEKLKLLEYALEQEFEFTKQQIPDDIISAFVKQVTVYRDYYEWKLTFDNGVRYFRFEGNMRNKNVIMQVSDIPPDVSCDTGGASQPGAIESQCFQGIYEAKLALTTLVITKEWFNEYKKWHPEIKKVNGWKDIVMKIYIV